MLFIDFSRDDELISEGEPYYPVRGRACEIGLFVDCAQNEICAPISATSRSRNGVCQCLDGYYRNATRYCVQKM